LRPVRVLWMRPFVADPDDLPEDVVEDAARSTPAAVSKTLRVARRELSGGRLARQARMVRVPALIVAGEEDQIVDPHSAAVWGRSLDQSEVCLMDGCGHLPMVERVAEFNAQVLAFLTGDARYLDYVERFPGPPAGEEPTEPVEPVPEEGAGEGTGGPGEREEIGGLRNGRSGPRAGGERLFPDLPENLFEWPGSWEEFRSGRRRRSGDEEPGGREGEAGSSR